VAELPSEVLVGVAYGLVAGPVPALAIGLFAVAVQAVTGRSVPTLAGATVAAGAAIAVGVGMGVFEPAAGASAAPRVGTAAVVAGSLGAVAASAGTRIGTELPREGAVRLVGGETLSADALEAVDAAGQVTIRPAGEIGSFAGYPPPDPALRTALAEDAWRLPADLQLEELERRLERRIRTDHGLSRIDVSIDGRGLATIAAAPSLEGVGTELPAGRRGVAVGGPFPAGIGTGDDVAVDVGDGAVRGEVLSVHRSKRPPSDDCSGGRHLDDGSGDVERLVVAVDTADAGRLLADADRRVVALPSRNDPVLEATSLLAEAGHPVRAIDLDGATATPPGTIGVRTDGGWQFSVEGTVPDGVDRAFVACSSGGERTSGTDPSAGEPESVSGPSAGKRASTTDPSGGER